jgi:hypothetical protein
MCASKMVSAGSTELVELADRLHSWVEGLRAGESQTLTFEALSLLVTDIAAVYAGSCLAAGQRIDIAPQGLSATDAVMLIAALMRAQNLGPEWKGGAWVPENTLALGVWSGRIPPTRPRHLEPVGQRA